MRLIDDQNGKCILNSTPDAPVYHWDAVIWEQTDVFDAIGLYHDVRAEYDELEERKEQAQDRNDADAVKAAERGIDDQSVLMAVTSAYAASCIQRHAWGMVVEHLRHAGALK